MSDIVLKLRDVSLSVDSRALLHAISFDVLQGQFTGLIGPNGAGKTTLLRCIYRYFSIDSGDVQLSGSSYQALSNRQVAQQISVVIQDSQPISHLTLYDVISLGLLPDRTLFKRKTTHDEQIVESVAERVGLRQKLANRFDTLSGGERQRGQLARALVRCPKLLILDEPTNHLDVKYQHEMLAMLKELNITTLATIHDLNLAASYCEQLVLLANGEVVMKGSPDKVLTAECIHRQFGIRCAVDRHPFHQTPYLAFAPDDERAQ